ncbi:hypothetical protein ACLFKL_005263, partial [Escherichia coli]
AMSIDTEKIKVRFIQIDASDFLFRHGTLLLLWLKFIHHGVTEGCREGEGRPSRRMKRLLLKMMRRHC